VALDDVSGPFGETQSIDALVRAALAEDVATGDVTTAATVTPGELETVRTVAETGVDWISVGALTHSAPALDLSCLIEPT
jgi:nicotinate-nucleotide pyrophosphorylase (carboxylating)